MRTLARIGVLAALVAGPCTLAAAAATTSKPQELPESYLLGLSGKLAPLRAAVTYQASQVPLALRVTPPDASWTGAQWKSAQTDGGGPPNFGWAAVGQGGVAHGKGVSAPPYCLPAGIYCLPAAVRPRGLIVIVTGYARTPSVAATVTSLRTRGNGATYEAASPVKLAGFSGIQLDGQVVGQKHVFTPFSPPSNTAKGYPDAYLVGPGVFRIIVLDVRGKTVVVFIDNVALPADRFPAFLTRARQILKSLRFPG